MVHIKLTDAQYKTWSTNFLMVADDPGLYKATRNKFRKMHDTLEKQQIYLENSK